MKSLGWVSYNSPIKPYNNFNRYTHYQVFNKDKKYYVGNKGYSLELTVDEIKKRFIPSNGCTKWKDIFNIISDSGKKKKINTTDKEIS